MGIGGISGGQAIVRAVGISTTGGVRQSRSRTGAGRPVVAPGPRLMLLVKPGSRLRLLAVDKGWFVSTPLALGLRLAGSSWKRLVWKGDERGQ